MTISSLGGIGGNYFTPIINALRYLFLVLVDLKLNLFGMVKSLNQNYFYHHFHDHIIDGAEGAMFISELCKTLDELEERCSKKDDSIFIFGELLTQSTMGISR